MTQAGMLHWLRKTSQVSFILLVVLIPVSGLVRIDFPHGGIVVQGREYWFSEGFLFWGALLFLVSLFYASGVILGRAWCGWLCPQGFSAEVAEKIMIPLTGKNTIRDESRHFGERAQGGWKAFYLILWILLAATGIFLLWLPLACLFLPADVAISQLLHGDRLILTTLFLAEGLFVPLFYLGHNVCKKWCPYGWILFLLWNERSLRVHYDTQKSKECMGCGGACDKVCPVSINVRRPEKAVRFCFNCAECLVACEKHNKPLGLSKLLHIAFGEKDRVPWGWWMPLLMVATSASIFMYGALIHHNFHVNLARDTKLTNPGSYTIKISNKDRQAHHYAIACESERRLISTLHLQEIFLESGASKIIAIEVSLAAGTPKGLHPFMIAVTEPLSGETIQEQGVLFTP